MTEIIESLAQIAPEYDALIVDLWGCLHDGRAPYPAAVAALQAFRREGGAVVLLTNAPRPSSSVAAQLARMNCPEDVRDAIVSSGDAAIASIKAGEWPRRVHRIWAEDKDEAFFEGLDLEIVPLADAEAVVVTGLRDDLAETPEDYHDELREAQLRGLPMLCVNPDLVVDQGGTRLWCAGALAELYEQMGGTARAYGKPHPPVYDLTRAALSAALGREVDDDRILCVGDGIVTDVKGGIAEGLDVLFVTGGIAAARMGGDPEAPEQARLDAFLGEHSLGPRWAMGRLR